ncbi:MAG TPA: AAA family ATPase [Polyangia bacterium]|nr:AAA family ATPase [Polyangia bacterium]
MFSGQTPPPAAKAEFVFLNGPAKITEPWTDGSSSSEALASIAIFDCECARLYVEEEGELAYRPYGLEMFDQLGDFYKRMKKRLADEAASIQIPGCVPDFQNPRVKATVEAALQNNSKEALAMLTNLGTVSDDERKEAISLQARITQLENDDPKKLALARRTLAERLTATVRKIIAAQNTVEGSVKILAGAMKKASDETAAAAQAFKIAFANEPVDGVGSDQWKAMFEDAKIFSTEVAYPGQKFPVIGASSHCVLCQQPLDKDAKDRLTRFADYIGNKAEERAREAARTYDQLRIGAFDAAKGISDIDDALIEQVFERDEAAAHALRTIRASFSAWQTSAGSVSAHDQWLKLTAPVADMGAVTKLSAKINADADELEKNSNAEALAKLKDGLNLLNDRITLSKILSTIFRAAECEARKRRLRALSDSIDTGHVSRQATKVTQQVLTDALCSALNAELGALDAESLAVEFAKKGEVGEVLHYLRLKNAPKGTKVEEVLSEGEHRCLATAAFLAELGQSGHTSAIVLDDPVSSLDHKHRHAVAARLVEEAKARQVVIFTHDLAFLYALDQSAAQARVPMCRHAVSRTSEGTGVLVDALYPESMPLGELISHIRTMVDAVAEMEATDPARRGKVADCYDLIRAAWERVVEESLLRSVVSPFDKAVHAQKLKGVVVEDEDHRTVFWAMKKASDIVEAHRTPPAGGTTRIPKDSELSADINALDAYRKATEKRAREIEGERRKLEKPPTY